MSEIDCYVQLRVEIAPSGSTVLERVHDLLAQGLLARFEAAGVVGPLLSSTATVVLVSQPADSDPGPDDQWARIALLRVHVRVPVADHRRSPEDIVSIVNDYGQRRVQMFADFTEQNQDLSYDDWKLALLRLTSSEN